MKYKLTYIEKSEKVSPRTGNPYYSLSLKTEQYGDRYLSGFPNKKSDKWSIGDEVELEVTEVIKDGKTYLNFKIPQEAGENSSLEKKVDEMLNRQIKMFTFIQELVEYKRKETGEDRTKISGTDIPYPLPEDEPTMQEEINEDEIPF